MKLHKDRPQDVAAGRPPWPVERLLTTLESDLLRYEPEQAWGYSNIGYLKVGQLIARASGGTLGDALNRIVFAPVGLTTARLAVVPEDLKGVQMGGASGYHPGWVYHGLVVGTTMDAARVLHALLAGALLQPATLSRMVDAVRYPSIEARTFQTRHMGLV